MVGSHSATDITEEIYNHVQTKMWHIEICSLWALWWTQNLSTQIQEMWTFSDTVRVHFGLILNFINANLGGHP